MLKMRNNIRTTGVLEGHRGNSYEEATIKESIKKVFGAGEYMHPDLRDPKCNR